MKKAFIGRGDVRVAVQVGDEISELNIVLVSVKEFEGLRRDSRELQALYNAGVDNWSGYDYVMDELRAEGFFDD